MSAIPPDKRKLFSLKLKKRGLDTRKAVHEKLIKQSK